MVINKMGSARCLLSSCWQILFQCKDEIYCSTLGEKSRLANNETLSVPVFSYKEMVKLGRENCATLIDSLDARKGYRYEVIDSDDIATIIYTSGTTSNPKGIMLSHKNLLHQIENLGVLGPAKAGDIFLSMLPTWHTYERAC